MALEIKGETDSLVLHNNEMSELLIEIDNAGTAEICACYYINSTEAQQIIDHLKQQFNI